MIMTGPARSEGASAETQVSSSSIGIEESSVGLALLGMRASEVGSLAACWSLRFLDLGFLSPLKLRGVGIAARNGEEKTGRQVCNSLTVLSSVYQRCSEKAAGHEMKECSSTLIVELNPIGASSGWWRA